MIKLDSGDPFRQVGGSSRKAEPPSHTTDPEFDTFMAVLGNHWRAAELCQMLNGESLDPEGKQELKALLDASDFLRAKFKMLDLKLDE